MRDITSLADLKDLTDVRVERVELPEIGAAVYVRGFDTESFTAFLNMNPSGAEFSIKDAARVAAFCLCDEKGKRIGDIGALSAELVTHSPQLVRAVYFKAIELSKLTANAIEAAEKK